MKSKSAEHKEGCDGRKMELIIGAGDNVPGLVCRFLPDFTITFANDAYCRYFNKDRGDILGKDFFGLFGWDHLPASKEDYLALNAGQPMLIIQHPAAHEGGRHLQWVNRAIFDKKDHIAEYRAVGLDITNIIEMSSARKSSEENLRLLMESASEIFLMVAPGGNGAITSMNPAFEKILGWSWTEWLGKPFWPLIHPDDLPIIAKMYGRPFSVPPARCASATVRRSTGLRR